jgi:predicted DCC family thiol-disulfide oxidoreductase YuxK
MDYPAVVLFDGVCNLCNSAVQLIIRYDKKAYFSFASLQGEYGQKFLKANNLNTEDYDSFILFENGTMYTESTAALYVAKRMCFPWVLSYPLLIIPKFIRDAVYRLIAKNRYRWFGKKEQCMIPSPNVQNRFIF